MLCAKSEIPFKPGNVNFVKNWHKNLLLHNFATLFSFWNTLKLVFGDACRHFDSAAVSGKIFIRAE